MDDSATWPDHPTRRGFIKAGAVMGAAFLGLPVFPAAADVVRPRSSPLVPDPVTLWYRKPGTEARIMEEGLPVGNGRLGALVTGDPGRDVLCLTDATLWTGGLNDTLGADGQFDYGTGFGSFQQLAKIVLNVLAHASPTGYRRQLDLSNGFVSARYQVGGVTYRRDVYVSHPDDVLVIRLSQSGGGRYTGSLSLSGTHGETTTGAGGAISFGGTFSNTLKCGAVAGASGSGVVEVSGSTIAFTDCADVLIVVAGGTNYAPTRATGYREPTLDPRSRAAAKARAALAAGATALLDTHVADYRRLHRAITVDLGVSTSSQRAMDTPARLAARASSGIADPELEASYLQFGRYLAITGSRGSLPTNLQGLWLDRNNPAWMSDYHTNINVQMNYWPADRAGLGETVTALADYCLSQLPSWTDLTARRYNDSRNAFRNSTGKVAGWTVATSANIHGGLGWRWNPAGNAWLCASLFEHYEFTGDKSYLDRIYPLLKGACEFWEARLITTTVNGRKVLIDDNDWSPEHGPWPAGTKGITYAQELVWGLFEHYREAAATLGRDAAYARTVAALQAKLHLPVVNAGTGWLEEWMNAGNLGETTHRHLSPLVGLHPGDRITADRSDADLLAGVHNLLTARGMDSFGWGCAWRALCWARLKHAGNAYRSFLNVLRPSVNFSNGTAINFFDMYSRGSSSVFQIDANFGAIAAMLEMLVYSRPGVVELLPALPDAWMTGSATGLGVRGGFTVDLTWAGGNVTSATIRSVGGTRTTVRFGSWSQTVSLRPGQSTTLTPPARVSIYRLVNRSSRKVLDVPGASKLEGVGLIEWPDRHSPNQHWEFRSDGALVNVNSRLVADIRDGASVIQSSDRGTPNQRWRVADAGGGYLKLVNVRSGKVMAVRRNPDGSTAVVPQTDTGDHSQHWLRLPV
ncbi:hypothetical protein Lesp02_15210 [Lentzea sp. NBRC 105346]|uniref:glycosyl hydrolase family 95 catalytic domain-containing protein n=1 Tax=Lentzea sp. NBRC 105346 TaxID=3032205 RepID=UPI0024A07FF4|nr:glycoside hydrolase N-terminal domain-containing protein [Lentzea sp. NBRC 105346]GLZ29331.1 hypothetical protein Lesp02_15210 [Lentzea sp. NBRC 105346]